MSGHAVHAIRSRIVNFTTEPPIAVHFRSGWFVFPISKLTTTLFRRRNARAQTFLRPEARIAHAKRFENIPARKLIQRHTADAMHYFAKRDVVDVAGDKLRPGRISQRLALRELDGLIEAGAALSQIQIGCVAGAMGREQLDRY